MNFLTFFHLCTICITFISAHFKQEKIVVDYLENIDVNPTSDIELFRKYLDEDSVIVWMLYPKPEKAKGPEEIKSQTLAFWLIAPDAKHKYINLCSKGNKIYVEGIYMGTFLNGEKMELPYIIIFTMKIEKIKSAYVYSDYGNFFRMAN